LALLLAITSLLRRPRRKPLLRQLRLLLRPPPRPHRLAMPPNRLMPPLAVLRLLVVLHLRAVPLPPPMPPRLAMHRKAL
jgi:hypothetical protein